MKSKIILILFFFSFESLALFGPSFFGQHQNIDPAICNMAILAGMTGQRPEGSESDDPREQLKRVEQGIGKLEEQLEKFRKMLADRRVPVLKDLICSPGDLIGNSVCNPSSEIKKEKNKISKHIVNHIKAGRSAEDCSGTSSVQNISQKIFLANASLAGDESAQLDPLIQASLSFFIPKAYAQDGASVDPDSRGSMPGVAPPDSGGTAPGGADGTGGAGVDAGGTGVDAGGTGVDAGGTGVDAGGTGVDAGGTPDSTITASTPTRTTASVTELDCGKQCECRYRKYFEDEGYVNEELCSNPLLVEDDEEDACEGILESMNEIGEELLELNQRKGELEDEIRQIDLNCLRAEVRGTNDPQCAESRQTQAGSFCIECYKAVLEAATPKRTGFETFMNAATPLIGAALGVWGLKESNRMRARQGYAVDNSAAIQLAYPFLMKGLYGMGSNSSLLCSSSSEIHSPYNMSMYSMLSGMNPALSGAFQFNPLSNLINPMVMQNQLAFNNPLAMGVFQNASPFGLQSLLPRFAFNPGGNIFNQGGNLFNPLAMQSQLALNGGGWSNPLAMGQFHNDPWMNGGSLMGGNWMNQIQLQQRISAAVMEQQQMAMEQARMSQNAKMRIGQEIQRLMMQMQTIDYNIFGGGGNFAGLAGGDMGINSFDQQSSYRLQ